MKECTLFDKCSAPLCPLDKGSTINGIWYPDEEVCKSTKYTNLQWLKTQKKIKKRTKTGSKYFTVNMMNRDIIVKGGITGLDPDKSISKDEKEWIEKHPIKRELSIEEKNMRREVFLKRISKGIDQKKSADYRDSTT